MIAIFIEIYSVGDTQLFIRKPVDPSDRCPMPAKQSVTGGFICSFFIKYCHTIGLIRRLPSLAEDHHKSNAIC